MHPLTQETSLVRCCLVPNLTVKLHSEHIVFPCITALLCVQPVGFGGGRKAIRPMLPLTLSPFLRTATIQHDNHVITNMSLCPFPSQPLANCVCVCFLLRLHPGLHHTICIPRGEEDGAQAGVASVGSPLHPSQQRRGVLRPRPQAPRQPPVWHDSQRLLQW